MTTDNNATGTTSTIPPEIRGWNWGAFLLNWIWGIGNNVLIALLCLVPCVNLVMPFILGFKGNEWAWKNKKWQSVEHFKKIQKIWAMVGAGLLACAVGFAALLFVIIISVIKQSDIYEMSLGKIQNDPQVISVLGSPIKPGWFVSGSTQTNGPQGTADLSFPVKGPKGGGTVYVKAHKDMGIWMMDALEVEIKGNPERLRLIDSNDP